MTKALVQFGFGSLGFLIALGFIAQGYILWGFRPIAGYKARQLLHPGQ